MLLDKARETAVAAAARYRNNKGILAAYCAVGIEIAKLTGSHDVYDAAIAELKDAEERIGDPDISRIVAQLERRISRITTEPDASETVPENE